MIQRDSYGTGLALVAPDLPVTIEGSPATIRIFERRCLDVPTPQTEPKSLRHKKFGEGGASCSALRYSQGPLELEYPFLRQQASQLHEVALKPDLERLIAVDGNRNADRIASLGINVMAPVDPLQ